MTASTQQLLDIEAIKALKARYFRAMDTKQWEELASCFSEDLVANSHDGRETLVKVGQPLAAKIVPGS